jgi:hypothetical protein
VVEAEEQVAGPPRLGSTYRLVVQFLGRRFPLVYEVAEIDVPTRVVLRAENGMVRSTDVIEVAPGPDGGAEVTYSATLTPKGVSALAAPLLGAAFRRTGDRATSSLRRLLAS